MLPVFFGHPHLKKMIETFIELPEFKGLESIIDGLLSSCAKVAMMEAKSYKELGFSDAVAMNKDNLLTRAEHFVSEIPVR